MAEYGESKSQDKRLRLQGKLDPKPEASFEEVLKQWIDDGDSYGRDEDMRPIYDRLCGMVEKWNIACIDQINGKVGSVESPADCADELEEILHGPAKGEKK